jgi:protocatechuate 3,4-dioxygenase beta subunit
MKGSVRDTDGQSVEDVTVDLWQANAAGRYRHPHDPNTAPLDEDFQGWAIVPSGKDGEFRFKTVFPGVYPAGEGWVRPPHIHFKVSKRGFAS